MNDSGLRGLILLAHGARDPNWRAPFERMRERMAAKRPDTRIALAFLEFMEPDLHAAGSGLAAGGCARVQVLPVFLGSGGHVRRDVPAMLERLRAAHPQVQWDLLAAIGESDLFIEAMADAAVRMMDRERP